MTTPFDILAPIAATINTGARFASLTYTAKGTGETARHTVALGVSIENAYKRDLAILTQERANLARIEAEGGETVGMGKSTFAIGTAIQACDELIASLKTSLEKGIGENPAYTCAETYVSLGKGIKAHKETGAIYIHGFSLQKTVISKGEHKTVKSSEKTLAKNALRDRMKSGKFRQFAISELHGAKMNGKTLVFGE